MLELLQSRWLCVRLKARCSNLSRHHFCRAFKVTFGKPPGRYITERRIDRAKGLLRDSRRSITEIALDLGFASHSHFTDAFRKIIGITPSRYRHDHA
jgi:AraC family transcriptional regulator